MRLIKKYSHLNAILGSQYFCIVLLVLGISFRISQYLWNVSLSSDEAYYASNIIHNSFYKLTLPSWGQHPPILFLWTERLFYLLFGESEYSLRLFPLITGLLSVFIYYKLLHLLDFDYKTILVAMTLFATSDALIYYASDIKPYSIDVMVTLLLLLLAVKILKLDNNFNKSLILLGITGLFSMWISYPSIFILLSIIICLFIYKKYQSINRLFIAVICIWLANFIILYFLFLKYYISNKGYQSAWLNYYAPFPPLTIKSIKWYLNAVESTMINPYGYSFGLAGLAFFIAIVGFFYLWYDSKKHIVVLMASPFLFSLIASAAHKYPFRGRLLLFSVPLFYCFISKGLIALRNLPGRLGQSIGLIAIILIVIYPSFHASYDLVNPKVKGDSRDLIKYWQINRKDNDILFVSPIAIQSFNYYTNYASFDKEKVIFDEQNLNVINYLDKLKKLKDNKRVWMLFSHTYPIDPKSVIINYLDTIGKKIKTIEKEDSWLYLYDLSNPYNAAIESETQILAK